MVRNKHWPTTREMKQNNRLESRCRRGNKPSGTEWVKQSRLNRPENRCIQSGSDQRGKQTHSGMGQISRAGWRRRGQRNQDENWVREMGKSASQGVDHEETLIIPVYNDTHMLVGYTPTYKLQKWENLPGGRPLEQSDLWALISWLIHMQYPISSQQQGTRGLVRKEDSLNAVCKTCSNMHTTWGLNDSDLNPRKHL